MSRSLRYLPAPGTLVEVTTQTDHGRLLLKPTPPPGSTAPPTLALEGDRRRPTRPFKSATSRQPKPSRSRRSLASQQRDLIPSTIEGIVAAAAAARERKGP
jgi:hypothetical protein